MAAGRGAGGGGGGNVPLAFLLSALQALKTRHEQKLKEAQDQQDREFQQKLGEQQQLLGQQMQDQLSQLQQVPARGRTREDGRTWSGLCANMRGMHGHGREGGGDGDAEIMLRPSPRDALEGKGPQRRPQKRGDRRLEEVAKAVGGPLLSVTNAVEAGTWRQRDSGWA